MKVAHEYLFNFSASPVGGGFKRLYEYAKWFDAHGGAWFMVHARCQQLRDEFPRNRFVVVGRSRLARMLDDFAPVRETLRHFESVPACYFAYGMPLYGRVARVNWFHLSNVLPLARRGIPLPTTTRLRFRLLGRQIRKGLHYADVISAESHASLKLFDSIYTDRLFTSVNGSDDELLESDQISTRTRQPIAIVVGTYPHKALDESCRVFEILKSTSPQLKLLVFGDEGGVPESVRTHPDVVLKGNRPRSEVIEELRRAKYYISTTLIENSYNAASEGIFLAEESYVSNIGPHQELLAGLKHELVALANTRAPLLHVVRLDLSGVNLKTWAQVIGEMKERIDRAGQTVGSHDNR
jgi:glycosyltransferase involved in cell wall biosynthesis